MSVSTSYSFSPTTTIESSQVNQNFSDLVNYINNTSCVPDMVVGWKGAVVDIPTGWTLDNDLKDRFVVGAGNTYSVGDTGGSNTINLSHRHSFVHTHELNHSHDQGSLSAEITVGNNKISLNKDFDPFNYDFRADISGDSTASGTADSGTNVTGSTGGADDATTDSQSASNTNYQLSSSQEARPPYYAICWIRKT